jgi:hypothetical protein
MYQEERKKFDNVWIGFTLGLIAPLVSLYIAYLIKYNYLTFSEFYRVILVGNMILTPVISLCVITNLLVFFIFVWTNRNYSARGVLFSTIIYAGWVVYRKFI